MFTSSDFCPILVIFLPSPSRKILKKNLHLYNVCVYTVYEVFFKLYSCMLKYQSVFKNASRIFWKPYNTLLQCKLY